MKHLLLLFFSISVFSISAQPDNEKAYNMMLEAIDLMDNGSYNESIKLLEECEKIDPKNYQYTYEIGFAYYLQEDYKTASKYAKKSTSMNGANAECYAMLGNCYDMDGKPEKAVEAYSDGLELFPNSGRLYFENGLVQEVLKNYNDALDSWEKGIYVDPLYASNYTASTIYYCNYTDQPLWGVLYGEIFMNIERGSKRTEDASKLLYDTYLNCIKIESDTSGGVYFVKNTQMSLPGEGEEIKLPFSMTFEIQMLLALTPHLEAKAINIGSLNLIRQDFIKNWFENNYNETYPNVLFDYHKTLIDSGYFTAYNYWLFMQGNFDEFDEWHKGHSEEFEDFITWFTDNPMPLTEENYFHSSNF